MGPRLGCRETLLRRLPREPFGFNADDGRLPDRRRDRRPEGVEPAICAFISSAILNYNDVIRSPLAALKHPNVLRLIAYDSGLF